MKPQKLRWCERMAGLIAKEGHADDAIGEMYEEWAILTDRFGAVFGVWECRRRWTLAFILRLHLVVGRLLRFRLISAPSRISYVYIATLLFLFGRRTHTGEYAFYSGRAWIFRQSSSGQWNVFYRWIETPKRTLRQRMSISLRGAGLWIEVPASIPQAEADYLPDEWERAAFPDARRTDAYTSGTPKDISEESHESISAFSYENAIRVLLVDGKKVSRAGWNENGMTLTVVPDCCDSNGFPFPVMHRGPWIVMQTADGALVRWEASKADIMATDWLVNQDHAVSEEPAQNARCQPTEAVKPTLGLALD
jgi:hypothetical protein